MSSDFRPTKDQYYLDIAVQVAKRSTCLRRRYGCVIVNNDEILSTGYNGNPRGYENCTDCGVCIRLSKPHNIGGYDDCKSVHAEQNALIQAARRDMIGATMYLAGEEVGAAGRWQFLYDVQPCPICLRMVQNSGVKAIKTFRGTIWQEGEMSCS